MFIERYFSKGHDLVWFLAKRRIFGGENYRCHVWLKSYSTSLSFHAASTSFHEASTQFPRSLHPVSTQLLRSFSRINPVHSTQPQLSCRNRLKLPRNLVDLEFKSTSSETETSGFHQSFCGSAQAPNKSFSTHPIPPKNHRQFSIEMLVWRLPMHSSPRF